MLTRCLAPIVAVSLFLSAGACITGRVRWEGQNDRKPPQPTEALGHEEPSPAPASAKTSVLDGVYTEAQARRGEAAYLEACASCHQADLSGEDMSPALVGTAFSFRWRDEGLDELFTSLRSTMPQEEPGSLSDQAYADIVAYMLEANDYPAGDQELMPDPAVLAEIAIEAKRR